MKEKIVKYLTNELSSEEREKLKDWLQKSKNKKQFDNIAKDNFDLNMVYSRVNSEKSFNKINQEISRKGRVIKLRNFTKYAAAIILLVTTGYFLTKNQFTTKPAIVEFNNDIQVGTDKATLTLEDGTNVALEKGKIYENEKVNSDGEKIVYQSNNNQPAKAEEKIAYNFLTIPRGGEFFIELEDGTKVWLNADTKLKYPVKFRDGEPREVELVYGEAYFDVSPSTNHNGDVFMVKKDDYYVEVLGTEFNLKAYLNETTIETTLVEGLVEVEVNNLIERLTPEQKLSYNIENNSSIIENVNIESIISWKEGFFFFDNVELKEVCKVISRWYNVDVGIVNENIENIKIKGTISKYQNIENILKSFKNLKNISYEITENKIYLN